MQYRQLGRSGLKVSPICLGTMMFGGPTDETTSTRIIATAREAGINFIDTADAYSSGNSEQVVGRAISNNRHNWVLATKLANPMGEDPNRGGLSRRWVLQAAEESLKRLGTDYIDIYYLHKEDHSTPLDETVRDGRTDPERQGALFRSIELSCVAGRRNLQHLRPARHGSTGRQSALLQRYEPHARSRALPRLQLLWARRRNIQPVGARRSDREIPPGCGSRQGHPRGPRRHPHDANRVA